VLQIVSQIIAFDWHLGSIPPVISVAQPPVIISMYPEKMTFDGFSVRTNRINEVARLIYSMDVGSSENKNRTSGNNSSLSCEVGMTRFELATPRPPDVCATGLRYIPKNANLFYSH
jgi:hypothetical protein